MNIIGEGQLLRIYVGGNNHFEGQLLYDVIINKARDAGLAGATMLRGSEGFGAGHRIKKEEAFRNNDNLPIVIEIIDNAERIQAFIPIVEKMVNKGLIIQQSVKIISYRNG